MSPSTTSGASGAPPEGIPPPDWVILDAIFTWSQFVNLMLPWMQACGCDRWLCLVPLEGKVALNCVPFCRSDVRAIDEDLRL